jgi:hypothetical protein
MLLFMYYIALFIPYIAIVNCDHLMHIRVDHAEPKTKIQVEQVQPVFGGPQAPSGEDADILVTKTNPSASNHYP